MFVMPSKWGTCADVRRVRMAMRTSSTAIAYVADSLDK